MIKIKNKFKKKIYKIKTNKKNFYKEIIKNMNKKI